MYVYVYTYIYVHIYAYAYIYIYICIYIYMCVYVCTYAYIYFMDTCTLTIYCRRETWRRSRDPLQAHSRKQSKNNHQST